MASGITGQASGWGSKVDKRDRWAEMMERWVEEWVNEVTKWVEGVD